MFKGPWQVEPTGPGEYVVTDMEGHKLFYIMGDEGDDYIMEDEGKIEPSILFHSGDVKHELLVNEIKRRLFDVP
jgi:hypothetical protein